MRSQHRSSCRESPGRLRRRGAIPRNEIWDLHAQGYQDRGRPSCLGYADQGQDQAPQAEAMPSSDVQRRVWSRQPHTVSSPRPILVFHPASSTTPRDPDGRRFYSCIAAVRSSSREWRRPLPGVSQHPACCHGSHLGCDRCAERSGGGRQLVDMGRLPISRSPWWAP